MDTKKISQIMRVAKSVARQSTKVVGAALPLASIGVTALTSYRAFPDRPEVALGDFISKYNGVNPYTGKFSGDRLMMGTGSLLLAGVAGWVINQVT